LGPQTEKKLRQDLRKALGEHFSVRLTYHDEIPRSASGKYFHFPVRSTGMT